VGKWDFLDPYDEQVHVALAAGDVTQAFEVLLEGYQKVVVKFCTTILGNEADGEDTAHDAFIAIFQALPRYQPRGLLRAWVFHIARTRCYKFREQLGIRILTERRPAITAIAMPDPTPSPDAVLVTSTEARLEQDLLDRLEPSLRRLPKRDRVLLMMYYWEELSFRAMAQQWRMPEATVRRAVHAAEGRLRTLMTEEKKQHDA
jgi:RNA polymerase sigma-70 factor (ECF subfamily)